MTISASDMQKLSVQSQKEKLGEEGYRKRMKEKSKKAVATRKRNRAKRDKMAKNKVKASDLFY